MVISVKDAKDYLQQWLMHTKDCFETQDNSSIIHQILKRKILNRQISMFMQVAKNI
jgi:hypothetical protein